jgi:hypothetical protein|tara:strand:+ start:2016 stop:2204 length:189 start_codon:yes stop_codon:yes gene_type:complete
MYWGKGVAETTCENCRIAVTTDGIEIDSSQGDIVTEAIILAAIIFVVATLYLGKKMVDKKFK